MRPTFPATTLRVSDHCVLARVMRLLRRHPLAVFFGLAFALPWSVMIPMALASRGLIDGAPPIPLLLLAGYGPTIAALVTAALVGGGTAVRSLLGRLLIWRVGLRWWAIVLLLPGAISLGALGLYALAGGVLPALPALSPALAVSFVAQLLVRGLINGEEIGWRGFALPRLQARYGALTASLIVGVAWALFHLPIFFIVGPTAAGSQSEMSFLPFLLSTLSLSVVFTWVANHTRGSILMAWLLHAAMNTWTTVLPMPVSGPIYWIATALGVLIALAIMIGTRLPGAIGNRADVPGTIRPVA